VLKIEYYVVM